MYLSQSHTEDPGFPDILFFQAHPQGGGGNRESNIGDSQLFRGPNLRRSVGGVVVSLHLKVELSTIYK